MKLRSIIGNVISLTVLAGCTAFPPNEPEKPTSVKAVATQKGGNMYRLERLHNFNARESQLEFTVTSHGCTQLEDFSIETEINGSNYRVSIYRIKADRCRRAPMPMTLTMDWNLGEQDSAKSVSVLNPIRSDTDKLSPARPVYK